MGRSVGTSAQSGEWNAHELRVHRTRVRIADPFRMSFGRRARRNRLIRLGVTLIAFAVTAAAIVLAIWLLDTASLPSVVDDFRPV